MKIISKNFINDVKNYNLIVESDRLLFNNPFKFFLVPKNYHANKTVLNLQVDLG